MLYYYPRNLWGYRVIRWVVYFLLGLKVFDLILGVMLELAMSDESQGSYTMDFPGTNPYRDLPDDPAILNAIKETMFIRDTLKDLLPTSLADDDYAYYSTLLRNLETRTDLTPLIIDESGVKQTMLALAQRRDSVSTPRAQEPFNLQTRFSALHRHWSEAEKHYPERWEDEYDTQPVPPLLQARGLVDDGTAQKVLTVDGSGTGGVKLELTLEQQKAADRGYFRYFTSRKYKVSYLKLHPPKPIGAVPRATSNEPNKLNKIWDNLWSSGSGDGVDWKPLYGSLLTENVPISWREPGNEAGEVWGMTKEEWEPWYEEQKVLNAKRDERKARIKAWQDEVRPMRQAEEEAKWQKMMEEGEKAEKLEL